MKSFLACAHVCDRNGGDIDRGATFTKGECLSTLSSPSSAFASRGEKREGGKVERKRDMVRRSAKYVMSCFVLEVTRTITAPRRNLLLFTVSRVHDR